MLDVGHQPPQRSLERVVARSGIGDLPRLVILTAEDDRVVVAVALEPQIVIRIRGVPEQCVSNLA